MQFFDVHIRTNLLMSNQKPPHTSFHTVDCRRPASGLLTEAFSSGIMQNKLTLGVLQAAAARLSAWL